MFNAFNTSFQLRDSSVDTAVMPMGSLEPKGPHLPVGLDMMLAERFAHDFSRGKAVYVLPTFPYSTAVESRGFKACVSVTQQTLWDVIEDVARFLARHGFKRLIVFDLANHNWILKHCVREINMDLGLLQAVWVCPRQFAREAADKALLPDYGGGAVDTSLAMALFPENVGKRPSDFDPGVPREYVDYEGLVKVAPDGYWGKPSRASAEAGSALYDVMLQKTAEYLDWALTLFPGGQPLGEERADEIWWPGGEIPGVDEGLDWHSSIAAVASSGVETVILPTSSTEQHSPSMPLATDYVQALELARLAAPRLGAYLLPALPYITSWGHAKYRGTVTLRAMTVRRVLEDAVASLHAGGWRKIVFVNFHGGNWVVKPTMIELARRYGDLRIISTGDILAYRGQAPVEQLHAEEHEGSFIQAYYPKAWKADKMIDYSPNCPASAFDLTGIGGVTPMGVWGYQSRGSAEQGRAAVAAHVDAVVEYVGRTFADLEKRGGK